MIYISILSITVLVVIFIFITKRTPLSQPIQTSEETILHQYVSFYKKLDPAGKEEFLKRIRFFLERVRITGIDTTVEDIDRVLVAAGAIIPIFHFKDWQYKNVREVLLYPNSFSAGFNTEGKERDIVGEVGSGALQNMMILSKPELRYGFMQNNTKSNPAVHEFTHLIDKADGATDGVPDYLLEHKYSIPWIKRIQTEMQLIQKGKSDINPYALTNEAEFFAVVSEYFFTQPDLMNKKHPELFMLLEKAFIETDKVA